MTQIPHPQSPAIAKTNRNQQIIARFERGDTLAEIADDFNISINRVRQIIKCWG